MKHYVGRIVTSVGIAEWVTCTSWAWTDINEAPHICFSLAWPAGQQLVPTAYLMLDCIVHEVKLKQHCSLAHV